MKLQMLAEHVGYPARNYLSKQNDIWNGQIIIKLFFNHNFTDKNKNANILHNLQYISVNIKLTKILGD